MAPAALLALTLATLVVIRSRSVAIRMTSEAALLALIGGYLLWRGTSPLPGASGTVRVADAWLRALAVVWWLIGARVVATVVVLAMGRDARSRQARLFSDLAAGAIYLTTVLIILNSVLNLPVNGLLATSGVIAIVLGLALQNTLADVFSGIAVGLEQPFHVGDRVSITDHLEGVVVQINWRSVRIQTDGEDIATIHNSVVAKSQIVNHSVPTARRAASVDIPTLSTERSERLIDLVRQAILLCPSIMELPNPAVAISHFGVRTTTLTVSFFVASSPQLGPAKAELLHQVRRLFRHAHILGGELPTPSQLLAGLTLFETLTTEQVERLAVALVRHRVEAGGTPFVQGSHGASLYVVRGGVFEITRQENDGRRIVYGRIGPGEYVGEVSMMSGEPRPATMTALSAAEIFELPRSAIATLLVEDHNLSAALERSVQRGLARLDRDSAARTCQPLDEDGGLLGRIRHFLQHRPG